MRKSQIIAVAAVGLLAFAAVAFATQTNTYEVSANISPTKVGTKKKPVPIALEFGYEVGEKDGKRPALINQYDIYFSGAQVNTNFFPGCSAAKIEQEQADTGCPKGSLMGTGSVRNLAGPTADESSKALPCYLDLKVYNSRDSKAALMLSGGPNDPRGAEYSCPLSVFKTIDARYVKRKGGVSLVFDVAEVPLLHPTDGFDNAVVDVESKIRKATVKKGGKTRGYYEAIGPCKGGKGTVTVTFRQVDGQKAKKSNTFACKAA